VAESTFGDLAELDIGDEYRLDPVHRCGNAGPRRRDVERAFGAGEFEISEGVE
jgi:hypothetical protein